MNKQKYGFILTDSESHIVRAYSNATYEQTLDGKLAAVNNGWTYVPMNLMNMIDELSKSEIYEQDGTVVKASGEALAQ